MDTPTPYARAPGQASARDPAPDGQQIQADFLRHAAWRPEAVALSHRGLAYSYGELESRSRSLALDMQRRGVGRSARVAIVAERTAALIWSMLACLRADVTFMVLDASYPPERLKTLIGLGAPNHLLGAGARAAKLAAELGAELGIPFSDAMRTQSSDAPLAAATGVGDLAYILFTSGSTAIPKAVATGHAPLLHFLDWQRETFSLTAEDRFTLLSGLSHDPLLRDVFAPLSLGARLDIPDQAELLAPDGARRWLARVGSTVVHATPAMGQLMAAGAGANELPSLRLIFWGGDLLPSRLLRRMEEIAPKAESVNFYGATETPQAAAYFRCRRGDESGERTPIGQGIAGFDLSVCGVDEGDGCDREGEIVVSSRYLSLGYLDGGELRAWPRAEDGDGESRYRTGDIGYRRADGAIVLLGRGDDQIKVRGYRVDLREIAALLLSHPCIEASAVVPLRDGERGSIAAFACGPTAGSEEDMRAWLAERTPDYMVPDLLCLLPSLPMLPNGKVDRLQLQVLAARPAPRPVAATPVSDREAALITAWAPLFPRKTLSTGDSFASLHGDSLSYVEAYLAAKAAIGEPPENWATSTITSLAAASEAQCGADASRASRVAWLETPILLRAVAILGVVCVHAHLLPSAVAPTSALFLVSGFLFTRLQLGQAHANGQAAPILRYLRAVAGPTLIFGGAVFLFRLLQGHQPSLSLLAMNEDFYEWRNFTGPPWDFHEPELWYLDALLHMTAFVGAAVLLGRRLVGVSLFRILSALFVLGGVLRFVVPIFWFGDDLSAAAHSFSLLTVLPTTHLATLCLGGMFACSPPRSQLTWAAGIAYAGLSAALFGAVMGGLLLVSMAIIDARRVPAFKIMLPPVHAIANASLFIYLANLKVLRLAFLLPAGPSAVLQVGATLAVGLGLAAGWRRLKGLSIKPRWRKATSVAELKQVRP